MRSKPAPVYYVFSMQMLQTTGYFSSIEHGTLFFKARATHIVYVKLKISTIHQSQNQTKCIFCLKCIRQVDLPEKNSQMANYVT